MTESTDPTPAGEPAGRPDAGPAGSPTALGDLGIDPRVPGFFLRPDYHDVLARLRAEAPVFEFAPGIKTVARYDDIREISRDPTRFCSGRGVLVNDPIREGHAVEGSILHMDPPTHNAWRKVLNREFTARALARMEPQVREITAGLLDALPPGEVVDAVEALTAPLPVYVICALLGIPEADRSAFRRWSDAAIVASDGRAALTDDDTAALMEMVGYLGKLAKAKRDEPGDDLVSLLVHADIEGHRPTAGELLTFNMSLVVAGNETTRHLMSGSLLELAARPADLVALYDDPDRIPGAVEELLRWITPIQQFARTATVDTDVGGVPVVEGDYLVMLYASGNRDEAAFGPTAGQLDLTREPTTPNLAFGFGEHFCLGAALARQEARVLFEELARRRTTLTLAGEPTYLPSSLVRGPSVVPMAFG